MKSPRALRVFMSISFFLKLFCVLIVMLCRAGVLIRSRSRVKAGSGGSVTYSPFSLTLASVFFTSVIKITADAAEGTDSSLVRSCAQTHTLLHNQKCATCPPTTHSHTHARSIWWITNHTTCPPERPRSLHVNRHRFPSAGLHGKQRPGRTPVPRIRFYPDEDWPDRPSSPSIQRQILFSDERQQPLTEAVWADGWIRPGCLMNKSLFRESRLHLEDCIIITACVTVFIAPHGCILELWDLFGQKVCIVSADSSSGCLSC